MDFKRSPTVELFFLQFFNVFYNNNAWWITLTQTKQFLNYNRVYNLSRVLSQTTTRPIKTSTPCFSLFLLPSGFADEWIICAGHWTSLRALGGEDEDTASALQPWSNIQTSHAQKSQHSSGLRALHVCRRQTNVQAVCSRDKSSARLTHSEGLDLLLTPRWGNLCSLN